MKTMDFIELGEKLIALRENIAMLHMARLTAKHDMTDAEYRLMRQVDYATLGTSDKAREQAKAAMLHESREWSEAAATVRQLDKTLIDLEARLAAWLDVRRAAEWQLRGLMVARWYAAGDEPPATDAGMDEQVFA